MALHGMAWDGTSTARYGNGRLRLAAVLPRKKNKRNRQADIYAY